MIEVSCKGCLRYVQDMGTYEPCGSTCNPLPVNPLKAFFVHLLGVQMTRSSVVNAKYWRGRYYVDHRAHGSK